MRKHLIVLMVILSFGIHAQSQTVKITQEFIERIQKYTELGRTRQTLWGGRTDANPKLSLNDT